MALLPFVLFGALLTSILFIVGKTLIGIYLNHVYLGHLDFHRGRLRLRLRGERRLDRNRGLLRRSDGLPRGEPERQRREQRECYEMPGPGAHLLSVNPFRNNR